MDFTLIDVFHVEFEAFLDNLSTFICSIKFCFHLFMHVPFRDCQVLLQDVSELWSGDFCYGSVMLPLGSSVWGMTQFDLRSGRCLQIWLFYIAVRSLNTAKSA